LPWGDHLTCSPFTSNMSRHYHVMLDLSSDVISIYMYITMSHYLFVCYITLFYCSVLIRSMFITCTCL
jgi:hypothetical protein